MSPVRTKHVSVDMISTATNKNSAHDKSVRRLRFFDQVSWKCSVKFGVLLSATIIFLDNFFDILQKGFLNTKHLISNKKFLLRFWVSNVVT